MKVKILDCDESIYKNKDKNGIGIKSWYVFKIFNVCINI